METKNYQLAIINPEVQDNYLVSEDTVTILPFAIAFSTYNDRSAPTKTVELNLVSLIDNPTINCKMELFFSRFRTSNFNLTFLTEVPPAYEYKISLYYVNQAAKLVHVSDLNIKNVRKNDEFVIPCRSVFEDYTPVLSKSDSAYVFAFCIKIVRKDVLANFNKKPALLLSAQITDCSLLFENSALTNCTVIVEDREFRIHKEILAAKSPVFLTMYESEMKEKKENQVIIGDIEAEVFHEFLRYIYTNVVNDLNVHAEKLLMVAEKYDVSKLKSVCVDEMSRSLSVENVLRTLMIADRCSLKCLKDRTMGFIRNNIKSILNTEEYKTLYKSGHAYLLNEIVQILA